MSSKRRIRRRQCEGKAAHKTEAGARIALRKLYSKIPRDIVEKIDIYKCKFCKHYHIGHRKLSHW